MAKAKEKIWTRKDVERAIEEHGGTARGLDLSGKTFEEGIDLQGLNLEGIILKKAEFLAHFWEAQMLNVYLEEDFLGDVNLEEARSSGAHLEGARLLNAHLEGTFLAFAHLERADLGHAHLEGANLFQANLEGAFLGDAHLEGTRLTGAHLEGAVFTLAHLDGASLGGAKFSADTKLEDVDWGKDYILGEEKNGVFALAADTYRRLKVWYTNAGIFDIAGEFFFRQMTAKRKMLKWWPNPFHRALSKSLSLLLGYGERPSRVVISAIVIIFGLAVAYVFGGMSLPYSIYFSAVSFTALGYGSWAYTPPENWVQGVGAFESFLGVLMVVLFSITFIRKMTR